MPKTMQRRENALGDSFLVVPECCGLRMSLDKRHIDADRRNGERYYSCLGRCGKRERYLVDNTPHTA